VCVCVCLSGVGREADLIIYDDMDHPPHVIVRKSRQLQRLGGDTLPAEGGVAVD